MIAPARALRKFATRIGQFGAHGCTAVELSADAHTLRARIKARGVEAVLTMPCDTTDGDLSPVSIAPARFFAGVTIADGDVRISRSAFGLTLTYDGGDVGLVPSGAVDPARYDAPEMIMVAPEEMRAALARVMYCVPGDENRYGLNGVYFEARAGLRLVATDGIRLAFVDLPSFPAAIATPHGYLVPGGIAGILLTELAKAERLAVGVTIGARTPRPDGKTNPGHGWIGFETESLRMVAALNIAEFPDYRQVLPAAYAATVTADRDALIKAARRVSLFGNRNSGRKWDKQCKAVFTPGGITLSSRSSDVGSARATCPAGVTGVTGPEFTIGVGSGMLLQALRALPPGPVEWSVGGGMVGTLHLGPTRLRTLTAPDSGDAILMPTRLD